MNMDDLPKQMAFVDLETTGCRLTTDRIIEIGIVRVEDNTITQKYQTLINPETYIPPFIQSMTHISESDVEKAPTFSQVKQEVFEVLEGCVFVAHNVRFDYGFLRSEFRREGVRYTSKHFCTAKLSKYLFPAYSRHNLDSIITRFGFICENRHRVFGDAQVLWDFYQMLQHNVPSEHFIKAVHFVLRKPSTPLNVPAKIIEDLPESPGVYIFYGENNAPLYVGKSTNIKNRVLSHFANDHLATKEMKLSLQARHIEAIKTAGELGALIRESLLIKQLQPLYNRVLRNSKALVVLKKTLDKNGYFQAKMEMVKKLLPEELTQIIGIYKSKRQAIDELQNLAKEHTLCLKLLGLEKTNNTCFGYQLKTCKGACVGKELTAKYNVRFLEAFGKNRIAKWPFEGAIIIREKDDLEELYEEFTTNQWCLLHVANNIQKVTYDHAGYFDKDIYTILRRYMRNLNNLKNISVCHSHPPVESEETFH